MAEPRGMGRIDTDPTGSSMRPDRLESGDGRSPRDGLQREIHAPPPKGKLIPLVIVLLVLAAAGGGYYFWEQSKIAQEPAAALAPVITPQKAEPEPAHYPPPVPAPAEVAEAKPLPAIDDSDPLLRDMLTSLLGAEPLQRFFSTQEMARHIVVTIDNLPRRSVAARLNPVKPAGGKFRVGGSAQTKTIAADNAARYAPYVRIAEHIDAKKAVAAYGRLYPLFQKAYEDLGYPKGFFNDRLIAVIDHLLGAPEISGPIAVVAPHVQYQFADPDLEAQSAGRKILVRIGPENAAVVKSKLREIRRELTKAGK